MIGIHTIDGILSKKQAGFILPHEHIFCNQTAYAEPEPDDAGAKKKRFEKVSLLNRGAVVMNPFSFPDDLVIDQAEDVEYDLQEFSAQGGSVICELSGKHFGAELENAYGMMAALAEKYGFHVVLGTGFYIESFWTEKEKNLSAEDVAREICDDFLLGIGPEKFKPGLVGEVGLSSPKSESERKSLIGAVLAQKEIGCALSIHPTLFTEYGEIAQDGHRILDIVFEYGGNPEKTILCHCDLNIKDLDYIESLARRGCYIEIDQMGMHLMSFKSMPGKFLPCDLERIRAIRELVDRGLSRQILISQDICYKHLLKKWGGFGYSHILENIIPMMIHFGGIHRDIVRQITYENPFRALAY